MVGSLPLRLPPAGTSGDQRDATCAMIGQFAGRSKRQHIARSAFTTLICRFEAERAVPATSHFSCFIRGDQYARVRETVHHNECVIPCEKQKKAGDAVVAHQNPVRICIANSGVTPAPRIAFQTNTGQCGAQDTRVF